jgi:hypothetical protein
MGKIEFFFGVGKNLPAMDLNWRGKAASSDPYMKVWRGEGEGEEGGGVEKGNEGWKGEEHSKGRRDHMWCLRASREQKEQEGGRRGEGGGTRGRRGGRREEGGEGGDGETFLTFLKIGVTDFKLKQYRAWSTGHLKATLNPVWNIIPFDTLYYEGSHLVVTIYDKDVGKSDEFMGMSPLPSPPLPPLPSPPLPSPSPRPLLTIFRHVYNLIQ